MAAVENVFGKGRTLLIGTFPGAGYYLHHKDETRQLFASFLDKASVAQIAKADTSSVQARLHAGAGGAFLWVTNATRNPHDVTITLADGYRVARDIWAQNSVKLKGNVLEMSVPGRDGVVLELR